MMINILKSITFNKAHTLGMAGIRNTSGKPLQPSLVSWNSLSQNHGSFLTKIMVWVQVLLDELSLSLTRRLTSRKARYRLRCDPSPKGSRASVLGCLLASWAQGLQIFSLLLSFAVLLVVFYYYKTSCWLLTACRVSFTCMADEKSQFSSVSYLYLGVSHTFLLSSVDYSIFFHLFLSILSHSFLFF